MTTETKKERRARMYNLAREVSKLSPEQRTELSSKCMVTTIEGRSLSFTIDAPSARRTFKHRERAGVTGYQANWRDQYEEYDSGEPGNSMSEAEAAELGRLLNVEIGQVSGGIGVPASYEYRREYLDRANGKAPSVIAQPYWD